MATINLLPPLPDVRSPGKVSDATSFKIKTHPSFAKKKTRDIKSIDKLQRIKANQDSRESFLPDEIDPARFAATKSLYLYISLAIKSNMKVKMCISTCTCTCIFWICILLKL